MVCELGNFRLGLSLETAMGWVGPSQIQSYSLETHPPRLLHKLSRCLVGIVRCSMPILQRTDRNNPTSIFLCPLVRNRWTSLLNLVAGSNLEFGLIRTPLDILRCALKQHRNSPARLVIISEVLWAMWKDRNELVFRQQRRHTPLSVILRSSIKQLEALATTLRSQKKLMRLQTDISVYILSWQTDLPPQ
jgi:hypothetical protein